MAKAQVSYFHRVQGADLAALERQHQRVFPGNKLAVLEGDQGLLAKVAYAPATAKPTDTLTRAEAEIEIEPIRTRDAERMGGR